MSFLYELNEKLPIHILRYVIALKVRTVNDGTVFTSIDLGEKCGKCYIDVFVMDISI